MKYSADSGALKGQKADMERQFRRAILTAVAASVVGGLLLAISLGVASGKFFASLVDLIQQAGFLATLFFSFFVGAALGARVRDLRRQREQHQAHVALGVAVGGVAVFIGLLYTLGFVDFGLFSEPGSRNSLLFAAVGGIGASVGFFRGYN